MSYGVSADHPQTPSPNPRAKDICFQDLQREDNRSWGLCRPTSLQEHGRGAPIVFFKWWYGDSRIVSHSQLFEENTFLDAEDSRCGKGERAVPQNDP